MLRERGPSSSANRIDWKRPSESSPPVIPTRDAPAEQRRAEVRRRVAALAVGVARIVVPVAAVVGDQAIQHGLEVLHESALELVHEQRARRVEGVDQQDALLDVGAQHDVADLLGDVDDLGALFAQHREGLPDHLQGLHRDALHVLGCQMP